MMGKYECEMDKYRTKMDDCECFSSEYWQHHDKYQTALVKKSCLADLLLLIEKE